MESIFDIETNGLLDKPDLVVHCLVIRQNDQTFSFRIGEIREGLDILKKSQVVIGHNILGFDLPALYKVYNFSLPKEVEVFDTLNASRLIYTNLFDLDIAKKKISPALYGKHSLKAWGYRLGELKGEYGETSSWGEWTPEMQAYCEQDVNVTTKLYDIIKKRNYSKRALDLEMAYQKIISVQENNGVLFNKKKANEYAEVVERDFAEIRAGLVRCLPLQLKRGTVATPKRDNRVLGYRKGASFTRISVNDFNPGSRTQIISYFQRKYGWEPEVFTKSGNAAMDEEVLSELDFPEVEELNKYFERNKILGFLKTGDKAWVNFVRFGRIHGRVTTNGAVTGRVTHSNPNLSQVPSSRKYMGRECRELFHAGEGWMVGADASGLELRMLAHYLYHFDGGKYGREILTGDIHSANQRDAGLTSRDQAKTFIFAFIYGAGDAKLGSIVSGHKNDSINKSIGKELRENFLMKVEGLRPLIHKVKSKSQENGYLKGLDGRLLHIRSQHSALNTLLQSAGAVVMKQANVNFWQDCPFSDCQQVLCIHDEIQFVTNTHADADPIGKRMVDSIAQAGKDFSLKIALNGEYRVGKNWAETH